jgi:anti-sigma regulatory factor (Ser/Thr protein kinase)
VAQFEILAERQSVRVARCRVRSDPLVSALSEADQADITLIVSELVSNAVEAATEGTVIAVDISSDGVALAVSVSNEGVGRLTKVTSVMSGGATSRGRGLALVSMLSREVIVTEIHGRTTVQALF